MCLSKILMVSQIRLWNQDQAYYMFTHTTQCVRVVLDPPVSEFSLSLYLHPFLYTLCSSHFTLIINIIIYNIIPKSHTHPSHSQTFRLLTSSLSLGIPVPRTTQCIRVMQIHHLQVLVFHRTDNHIQVRSCLYLSLYRLIINKKDIRKVHRGQFHYLR